jgi:hypothetical protein
MAIQSIELCVVRGDDTTLSFIVGDITDATLVVQLRPGVDLIRRGLLTHPSSVRLDSNRLYVDIASTDFAELAESALTVAKYSLILVGLDGLICTYQTGNFKIFRHPQ